MTTRVESDNAVLTVADTGPGIPEEELPRLFERFHRADKARGGTDGTGHELAISKAIVEAHNGTVAGQVAAWLREQHGLERAAKSLYYWLGKVGGALRVPRPCHVRQDPAAAAAFRANLEANLEKLNLPRIGW